MTKSRTLSCCLAASAVLITIPAHAQSAQWRQDLKVIAEQLPSIHPNAFFRLKKESWDSAITSIDRRLPEMSRNQAMVALSQLVAMVNDGHTSINPLFDPAMDVHYYPVRYEQFEDGLFIRSAAPRYKDIVGAKVLRIGNAMAEDAVTRMATTFGHENEWWIRGWAPIRLNLAEFLDGLGISSDVARLPIVVEKDGKRQTVILTPSGHIEPGGHNPLGGYDMRDWIDMRGPGNAPPSLSNPAQPNWFTFLPKDSSLYVQYRAVVDLPDNPNNQFWRNVFAASDSLPVRRFILDIRENGGGNGFFNRQVVRGIIARPRLDNARTLFVLIGDRTFSAAMNLAQDLEQWTNATFVGEPTGNALVFFGDHRQVRLPVSGITVNISTLPWYPANPRDTRDFIAPRMYTPFTSVNYRSNVDPALDAIARFTSQPSLGARIDSEISRGDTAAAMKLIADARIEPINRFRSPELDVNALGYRLLPTDKKKALAVFRLNTIAFPNSANVWDSYGEALAESGDRDAAIAAYRKALSIDPRLNSSAQALARLGASPT